MEAELIQQRRECEVKHVTLNQKNTKICLVLKMDSSVKSTDDMLKQIKQFAFLFTTLCAA